MKVYPVMKLKNQHCVAWQNGHYHSIGRNYNSPEEIAVNLEALGCESIHIFDIDGFMMGHTINDITIKNIIDSVGIPIQLSGGIRSIQNIEQAFRLGISKVNIGVQALINPLFVKDAVSTFGNEYVSVSLTAENGIIISNEYQTFENYNAKSFIFLMKEYGIRSIIYSDVLESNFQQAPNIEHIQEITRISDMEISVVEGIQSLKDLERLNEINVDIAIVGQSLHGNKLNLKEALELFDKGGLD